MKEKRTIDLGYETPDYSDLAPAEPSKPKKMKTQFPCIYVKNSASLKGIPMEGTATIKYRLAGFNDRSGDDPSMDLEVQSIEVDTDPEMDMANSEDDFESNMQSAEDESNETQDEENAETPDEQASEVEAGTEQAVTKPMAKFGKPMRIDSSKYGARK